MASTNHKLFRNDSNEGPMPAQRKDFNQVQSSAKIAVQPVGAGSEGPSPGYDKYPRIGVHQQGGGSPNLNK